MPTSVELPTSHHYHPPLSPVVSLSFGILHEWMRTQMLAKPSSNLLQGPGGDHRSGRAQPGWRTFMMTCLRWILGFTRLEIWRKIGLSGDWCLCTSLRTRSGACYIYGIYLCRYLACWCRSPPNLPSSSRESPADSCSLGAPDSRHSPIDSAAAEDELRLSEITHAVIRNTQIRSVLFFSGPRIKGWPHHGRTFSIYIRPLSFWLTLPWTVLYTSWCCPSRPCVAFLACVHLVLFLALPLSPGNSLVSWHRFTCDQKLPVSWI